MACRMPFQKILWNVKIVGAVCCPRIFYPAGTQNFLCQFIIRAIRISKASHRSSRQLFQFLLVLQHFGRPHIWGKANNR